MATIDRRGATVSATDAPASSTPNPDLAIKTPVRVATTGNINLQTIGLGPIDGVTLSAGDRVLVKDQTDKRTNGIYNAGTGVWGLSSDFQNNSQVACGCRVFVNFGTVNAFSEWEITTLDPIVLGTSQITFSSSRAFGTGPFTFKAAGNDNSNGAFGISGALTANFYSGGSSAANTSTNPTVFIARTETINGPTTSQSSALLVVAFGKGNVTSQTQAISAYTNKDAASTGDSVAMFGQADNFGSGGTAFGAFFQATNHGNSATLNAIAVETGTINGSGVNRPYNPTPGSVPANIGLDISYGGTADGSAHANGGPAIQIRSLASDQQWDVGIGFMNGSPIKKAEIQSDTNATSLWLVNSGSHTHGLNWTAGTFTVDAIATPGFTVDGTGAIGVNSTNGSGITSSNQSPLAIASSNAGGLLLPLNATVAGKSVLVAYEDAGAVKWYVGKDTDNAFILNDNALGKTIFRAASNNSGIVDFGVPGTFTGQAGFAGVTSGRTILQALAAASGTLTLPSATDTIAVLAASQAFTNKTYNGLTITTTTGTLTIANGKTLTANSTLTLAGTDGKTLTVSNSGTLAGGDGFTLSIAANKTLTASNSLTLAGTDGKSLTLTNGLTVTTNDGTLAFGAASKTLTVNNSLTLAGTDATTMTFPGTSQTIAGLAVSGQTFTTAQTVTPTQAANTSVDGLILADTTAASAGNQQYSPRLRLTGQGWKTNATAASETVDWIIENRPVQAAADPQTSLVFSSQVNGAGYNTRAQFQDQGGGFLAIFNCATGASSQFQLQINGSNSAVMYVDATQAIMGSVINVPLKLVSNNTTVATLGPGIQVGSPTGGDKGAGTINVASNIYLNNTAYTNPDYVLEHHFAGRIEKFIGSPGARDYGGLMPLAELREYTREHWRLPGITDEPCGVVERHDIALAKIEETTLYLFDHEDRIRQLAAENENLRSRVAVLEAA